MKRIDFTREEQARKRLATLSIAADMPASKVLRILIENAPPADQLRQMAEKNESGAVVVQTPAPAL